MSFHIALQSGNANQVSSIYILSFHTKQSLPRILPTLQHSKLYRQARQAVQPWPATSCHFLSKGAPNENLQKKNIKSWLEHRNSYGHVFSLKIEASMNPLLYKLSNFQVLQSETSSGSSKVTFFQGQKNVTSQMGNQQKRSLWRKLAVNCSCDRCFPIQDSIPIRFKVVTFLCVNAILVIVRFPGCRWNTGDLKVQSPLQAVTPIEVFLRVFTPLKTHGFRKGRWDNFLLGFRNLSGASCCKFRVVFHMKQIHGMRYLVI